jgi:hypothetical protein
MKLNAARSTFAGDIRPKSLTVRIEPHARGEVVGLDRTEVNGQTNSSSMVLYLDRLAGPINSPAVILLAVDMYILLLLVEYHRRSKRRYRTSSRVLEGSSRGTSSPTLGLLRNPTGSPIRPTTVRQRRRACSAL